VIPTGLMQKNIDRIAGQIGSEVSATSVVDPLSKIRNSTLRYVDV